MITLRTLRVADKFTLDGIEYRKLRPTRIRNLGVVNVQNVVTNIKSYLPEDVFIIPKTDAYLYRRTPIVCRPFVR